MAHIKGGLGRYQSPAGANLTVVVASPHIQSAKDQPHPLANTQQPRPNYNRKAHTIHTRDTPGALGSGDQGDYVTVLHRTPTTEGHPAKSGRHSRSTKHTETNTERQPKMRRQRNMSQMKIQEKTIEKELIKWKQAIYQYRFQNTGCKTVH